MVSVGIFRMVSGIILRNNTNIDRGGLEDSLGCAVSLSLLGVAAARNNIFSLDSTVVQYQQP